MPFHAIIASTSAVSRSFNNRPTASLETCWYLIAAVAGIALVWIGLYVWERIRKQLARRDATPLSLFRDLCAAHELGRNEQALLETVVERNRLEHPAVVFVAPALLREMAGGGDAAEYARLARKLFGAHA
ncbi:MAG: hypothetical protein WED34_19330 [Planctomycetales bacterium]